MSLVASGHINDVPQLRLGCLAMGLRLFLVVRSSAQLEGLFKHRPIAREQEARSSAAGEQSGLP